VPYTFLPITLLITSFIPHSTFAVLKVLFLLATCLIISVRFNFVILYWQWDRLCGLAVRVPGYRSWGLGSIPAATRFSDKIVGLEQDTLRLVSTIHKLLERKRSGLGLENREYGHRDLSCWPRDTLYQQKLALTWPTSNDCSVLNV
jgi:hypothetical protein